MSHSLNLTESIGRYKILRELGRGGMSVVYLAKDEELEREVAIKCVDTSKATTARLADSLRAEAKLLAQLNHPNIVQLYDVVEQDHILGLVIEYVGGETLSQRLKQVPNREMKLRWLAEIAQGLSSAHKKGIAHCDLKADNILITDDNTAKVADFGIAKLKLGDFLEDDGLTRIDNVSGSYFSLSPEQATGQAVDSRTDIFSLAVLIYQTLLGKHPFGDTSNKIALIQRLINNPLQLNETATKTLGPRLTELLSNSLSKRPEDRLYDASEISELLKSDISSFSNSDISDPTIQIKTQVAEPIDTYAPSKKTKGLLGKGALIISGFVVGVALFSLWPSTEQELDDVSYVALDNIEVSASEGFNKTLLPLIKTTVQQSTEATLLSFERTGLVDAKELNSIEGDFRKKATAAGVNNIVVVSANCLQQKCDIKIQKRSGDRMAVSQQTSFPVASDSLIGLRNAISTQLSNLLDQSQKTFSSQRADEVSEEDYRRYLEIYTDSDSGFSVDHKYFDDIQTFISEKPSFTPSYSLLYRLGGSLHRNSGDKKYLETVFDIFERSPSSIKRDRTIRRAKVKLLLDMNLIAEAKSNFVSLENDVSDQLFLSEIESSIAYAENNYDKLLVLDRQNAAWRPSVNNLYNLATSEFFFGNHNEAKEIVEKVLDLSPNDLHASDLKATIEMSLGNLSVAIQTYEEILQSSESSNTYSNYGLALSLNMQFEEAIEAHKKAITINPEASLHHLNLADSYKLGGASSMARQSYELVIVFLAEPKTAQEYGSLAQAQAHLGNFSGAVKTLKTANKKFPNIAELNYAAAIVNTLSSNHVAAIVDAKDAIDGGTAPIWFSFKWFKPLCDYQDFIDHTGAATGLLCN